MKAGKKIFLKLQERKSKVKHNNLAIKKKVNLPISPMDLGLDLKGVSSRLCMIMLISRIVVFNNPVHHKECFFALFSFPDQLWN